MHLRFLHYRTHYTFLAQSANQKRMIAKPSRNAHFPYKPFENKNPRRKSGGDSKYPVICKSDYFT